MNKRKRLEKLNISMSKCSKCVLHCGASRVVPGNGNPEADIMFIGEAPGKKEDETGIPFIGSSGKILEKMLSSIELKRKDVYLTNILKCRPPENRDPLPDEIANCLPWLFKQIEIVNPQLVVTLGRFSLNCFLHDSKISLMHGKIIKLNIPNLNINLFPLHHPAAARQNKKTRALFETDFKKIPAILMQTKKEQ